MLTGYGKRYDEISEGYDYEIARASENREIISTTIHNNPTYLQQAVTSSSEVKFLEVCLQKNFFSSFLM